MEILNSATKISFLLITWALIYMAIMWIEVTEPFKTIAIMVYTFYFGQKVISKSE